MSSTTLSAFKAGGTFSYAGQVTGLDPSITWGAKSTAKPSQSIRRTWSDLQVTFLPADDFDTSHKYDISISAPASDTLEWRATSLMEFDILFFNADEPDPVLLTKTIRIPIVQPVTER